MTDAVLIDRARKQAKCIYIAVDEDIANDVAGCLNSCADRIAELRTECAALRATLAAAEKRADEAYAACERVAQKWIDPNCGCDACQVQREVVMRIRALSPLTALPQTTRHETAKHETTGNED